MLRTALSVATATLFLVLGGCKAIGTPSQDVVLTVASAHPDCVRLTLHCRPEGKDAMVCASTAEERLGTASDPEDLRAMDSGQVVVLDEGDNIDVTVPIHMADGKCMTVCGVTMKPGGRSREQAIAEAKVIAAAVEASLGGACCSGDCCSGGCCSDE